MFTQFDSDMDGSVESVHQINNKQIQPKLNKITNYKHQNIFSFLVFFFFCLLVIIRVVSEAEFFQGLSALGFVLTSAQNHLFFDAVDSNHNGVLDISEFAALIVNPNRNPKLSTKVRYAPGGASSVPMGSFASTAEEPKQPFLRSQSGKGQFDLASSQVPLSKEEQDKCTPRHPVKFTGLGESKIDLSFQEGAQNGDNNTVAASPSNQSEPSSAENSRPSTARNPPGGRSTVTTTTHGSNT